MEATVTANGLNGLNGDIGSDGGNGSTGPIPTNGCRTTGRVTVTTIGGHTQRLIGEPRLQSPCKCPTGLHCSRHSDHWGPVWAMVEHQ